MSELRPGARKGARRRTQSERMLYRAPQVEVGHCTRTAPGGPAGCCPGGPVPQLVAAPGGPARCWLLVLTPGRQFMPCQLSTRPPLARHQRPRMGRRPPQGIEHSGLLPATFTDTTGTLGIPTTKIRQLIHALAHRTIRRMHTSSERDMGRRGPWPTSWQETARQSSQGQRRKC